MAQDNQLRPQYSELSHHLDIVKQDTVPVTIEMNLRQDEAVVKEEVVTLTAAIETNFQQGDPESDVDGTKGDLTETQTETEVCLRKRKPDDVSTSVLNVEVNEMQRSVW